MMENIISNLEKKKIGLLACGILQHVAEGLTDCIIIKELFSFSDILASF